MERRCLAKNFGLIAERALKTVAQSALAYLGTGTVGLFELDWTGLLSISLGAGLLSILTSIISKK
jgi:hypothetical protein